MFMHVLSIIFTIVIIASVHMLTLVFSLYCVHMLTLITIHIHTNNKHNDNHAVSASIVYGYKDIQTLNLINCILSTVYIQCDAHDRGLAIGHPLIIQLEVREIIT